jgi:hypothetical protein
MPPAARLTDVTDHVPCLNTGPCSPDIHIGDQRAWRALPEDDWSGLEAATEELKTLNKMQLLDPATARPYLTEAEEGLKEAAENAAAHGNNLAASVTASAFATLMAKDAELTAIYKAELPIDETMAKKNYADGIHDASQIAAAMSVEAIGKLSDQTNCPQVWIIIPHGPGVITKGAPSVYFNDLPAAREEDVLYEAIGGPDPVAKGFPTVIIGDEEGTSGSWLDNVLAWKPSFDAPTEQLEDLIAVQEFFLDVHIGAAKGVYAFGKGMVEGIWVLLKLGAKLTYDAETQIKAIELSAKFAKDQFVFQFGTLSQKHAVLQRYTQFAVKIGGAIADDFKKEWAQAQADGKEVETISKWTTQGILEIGSMFIGVGEIKTALKGAQVTDKVLDVSKTAAKVDDIAKTAHKADDVAKVRKGSLPKTKKAVNSNLQHAVDRAVQHGVFSTRAEATERLRQLTRRITDSGLPEGAIRDTARADRVLVPIGNSGMAVYQVSKNGTAKLKTVLIAK